MPKGFDQIRRIGVGLGHLAVRFGDGAASVEIELDLSDESLGRNLLDRIGQIVGVGDLELRPATRQSASAP